MKGMLFKPEMVEAIVEGRKTETRRLGDKPRYKAGEIVYIKESGIWDKEHKHNIVFYKANFSLNIKARWQSTLFMPQWAARYFIEITDVRCERLQDITEEGALREGIQLKAAVCQGNLVNEPTYRDSYAMLWDAINGEGSWDKNPFVWVYQFKVQEQK